MNLLRPTRSTLILSCCLALLAGGLGYQHYLLTQLRGALDGAAEKSSIDAMLIRLSSIDERLDSVDGKHLVSDKDFRAGQQALSNRIDAAQASAQQANDAIQELSQNVASTGELLSLKATIDTLDGSIQELRKSQSKVPPLIVPARSATKQKPKPAAPEPPPFNVIGVEYRGGERFLSLAPLGSTRLSQIYLIRPGDAIAGTTWRLSTLDDRSARFDVAGTTRTISFRP
jgi:hypothetical protein